MHKLIPILGALVLFSPLAHAKKFYPRDHSIRLEWPVQPQASLAVVLIDTRPFMLNFPRGGGSVFPPNYFGFGNAYGKASTQIPYLINPWGKPTFLGDALSVLIEDILAENKVTGEALAPIPLDFKASETSLLLSPPAQDAEQWQTIVADPSRLARQRQLTALASKDTAAPIKVGVFINDFLFQFNIGFSKRKESNGFHYDVDVVVLTQNGDLLAHRAFRAHAVPEPTFIKKAGSTDCLIYSAEVLFKRVFLDPGIRTALAGKKDETPYEPLPLSAKHDRLAELVELHQLDAKFVQGFIPAPR